jgi:hypothetical protein
MTVSTIFFKNVKKSYRSSCLKNVILVFVWFLQYYYTSDFEDYKIIRSVLTALCEKC